MSLLPSEIAELWLVQLDEVSTFDKEGYISLLSSEELSRYERFHFKSDRDRYLTTRALIRTTLSKYFPIRPEKWEFTKSKWGRPAIAPSVLDTSLSFNISHTSNFVVLAVVADGTIGVDVEAVTDHVSPLDVAGTFFSRHEYVELKAMPAQHRLRRFYEFWTLKEAYLKALGAGLSLPLNSLVADLSSPGHIRIIDPVDAVNQENWEFWQFQPDESTVISVCLSKPMRAREWSLRKLVPLRQDRKLTMLPTRKSTQIA
jgi:4'-phosphopantetheinyl transferase